MIRRRPSISRTALVLLLASSALPAQVTFNITSVAQSGDAAPVPPELVRASSPSLNNGGAVAFAGDGGVFLESDSGLIVAAGYGDPAPGGGTFRAAGRFYPPSMNASGQIVFFAEVDPPGANGIFVYSSSTGAVSKIVARGDPAPGGGRFFNVGSPALNDPGQVAFVGAGGIFLSTSAGFTRLVRSGDPAPGGGLFDTFTSLSLNAGGTVAFLGTAAGGQGIYTASGSTVNKIARAGDPAPQGGNFTSFGAPSLNAAGQVAFAGTVNTGATGLYLFSQGQITRLATEGDPAPGGGVFASLSAPSLNGAGDVAFVGNLSPFPPNCCFGESGVFLYSSGNLSKIVRPGDASPEGGIFSSGLTPSLNDLGQVAFAGRLNDSVGGIYLFSQTGIARIAGQGDPVMRDPKFFDALLPVINNAGQIVFGARMFPGGGGLFDAMLTDIARSGDVTPDGSEFAFVAPPAALNDNGQVAFWGQRSAGKTGLFLSSVGTLRTIVSSGDAAPGGGSFRDFFNAFLAINSAGDVVADGTVSPPGRSGLFRFSNTEVSPIVQIGDPAPGGGTFTEIGSGSMNEAGDVAFVAFVSPPGRSGIFLSSANTLQAIAQTGDAGGTFQFLQDNEFDYTPSVNSSGQVAFTASLMTPFDEGVFLYSGGQFSTIAEPGTVGPGGTFLVAQLPSLNDMGQVVFFGDTATFIGTFLFSNGTITKVAVTGDPAPGGGTLIFPVPDALNNQGQVAFDSGLSVGGFGAFLATPSTTPASRPAASVIRDAASYDVCTNILDTLVSRRASPHSCR